MAEWVAGMTLRDWFAGQALPAILNSAVEFVKAGGESMTPEAVTKDAYEVADAMLKARERE